MSLGVRWNGFIWLDDYPVISPLPGLEVRMLLQKELEYLVKAKAKMCAFRLDSDRFMESKPRL